jgi:hypothetical protein
MLQNCETVNKTETSVSAVCPTDLGHTINIIQQRKQIYDKQIFAKIIFISAFTRTVVEPKRSDRKKFKWKMINDTIHILSHRNYNSYPYWHWNPNHLGSLICTKKAFFCATQQNPRKTTKLFIIECSVLQNDSLDICSTCCVKRQSRILSKSSQECTVQMVMAWDRLSSRRPPNVWTKQNV